MVTRCPWANHSPLLRDYHDREWGVPQHTDRKLFEFLVLEGAQAGLSWETILKKRARYRRVFGNFDPRIVARYTSKDVRRLLADPGIVRNRQKIVAAIQNAKKVLEVQKEFGVFSTYLWKFVGGRPLQNRHRSLSQLPATTSVSVEMSKDLRRRGFKFAGPTICYAFMQAVGMVNDHITTCFRHHQVARLR